MRAWRTTDSDNAPTLPTQFLCFTRIWSSRTLLAAHRTDRRHDLVRELSPRLRRTGADRQLLGRADGLAERDLNPMDPWQSLARGLHLVRPRDGDRDDRGVARQGQPRDAGVPLVELAVARACSLGVDPEGATTVEDVERVLQGPLPRPRVVALDRDVPERGEEPAEIRPLTPVPSKYSALARNVTCRGATIGMISESMNDRWLLARMTGPLRGMLPRPVTSGRRNTYASSDRISLRTR